MNHPDLARLPTSFCSIYLPARKGGGVARRDVARSALLPVKHAGGYVHRAVVDSLLALHRECLAKGIDLRFSDVFRTLHLQRLARERWDAGQGPYACTPGNSWHNSGRAFDCSVEALGEHYDLFVEIAASHGWRQVSQGLRATDSECWHFQAAHPTKTPLECCADLGLMEAA